jgi:hypothetical protein
MIFAWSGSTACPFSSRRAYSIRKCPAPANFFASQIDSNIVNAIGRSSTWARDPASARCSPPNTRAASWRWTSTRLRFAAPASMRFLNHLEHKIDVRHGDLFAPVHLERFRSDPVQPALLKGPAAR